MLMNGLVRDFNFAARLKGRKELLSTCFYLPPNPNVVYSAALMNNAEKMFMTGNAPSPIERTLLTSGMVQSALQSLHLGQRKIETPYQPQLKSYQLHNNICLAIQMPFP